MEDTPNYQSYSYQELIEARDQIDRDMFPERASEIDKLIASFEQKTDEQTSTKLQTPKISLNRELYSTGVKFHGDAKEYFRIWIVNLLLSIVTLGIYSAWATVRNNRYFYSNTEIDGHRFAYLATPIQILKGRIIGVVLFGSYFLTSAFAPAAALVVLLVLFILTPALLVISLRFRLRMTAYRNVRFNFNKDFGGAYFSYLFLPFVGLITFYLAFPWVVKKMNEYVYKNITFGDKPFYTELASGVYYFAVFASGLAASAVFIVGMALLGGPEVLSGFANPEEGAEPNSMTMIIFGVMYLLTILVSSSIWTSIVRNHIYDNTLVNEVASFNSKVAIPALLALNITNILALICTLGFAMPWVKVRTMKFYADATQVNIKAGADSVIAQASASQSAVADEVSNIFDVDVAIG